jgi:GAF domain-containing protein
MENIYNNSPGGAQPNPVMPAPDAIDAAFATAADAALQATAELARKLIGAHQGAAAIVVQGDWATIRKFFSLSPKYADWADYATPATGYGAHGWILRAPQVVRLTQAELEAHPEWRGFGTEAARHPPMRGWLAAPLRDRAGTVWGLVQLSDRIEGDFTTEDEVEFLRLVALLEQTLEALWEVRNLRKAALAGEGRAAQ